MPFNDGYKETILALEGVCKYFHLKGGYLSSKKQMVTAVKDVSLSFPKGITYGLVGESGCGKTTLSHIMAGLLPPDRGKVIFNGEDLYALGYREFKERRKKIQLVFQDPYSSLNPRLTVGYVIKEALRQGNVPKEELEERAQSILISVGLDPSCMKSYPHQLSGGQRQRVVIARALCVSPVVLIMDEPVSSLDVLIQAQILDLFLEIKQRLQITYIFISHDLKIVAYLSDIIGVMFRGEILEEGPSLELYKNPLHPYTQLLLASVPKIGDGKGLLESDPMEELKSEEKHIWEQDINCCAYYHRCNKRSDECVSGPIELKVIGENRRVRCIKV